MSLGWTSRTISWKWHEKHGFTRVSLHLLAHLETAPKTGAHCDHEEFPQQNTGRLPGMGAKPLQGHVSQVREIGEWSYMIIWILNLVELCLHMYNICTIIYNKLYGGFLKQDNKEWLGTRQALGLATCLSLAKNACSWEKDWTNLPGERYIYIYIYIYYIYIYDVCIYIYIWLIMIIYICNIVQQLWLSHRVRYPSSASRYKKP